MCATASLLGLLVFLVLLAAAASAIAAEPDDSLLMCLAAASPPKRDCTALPDGPQRVRCRSGNVAARLSSAAHGPNRCDQLADEAARLDCRAGLLARLFDGDTRNCRKGASRGSVFICNAARRRSPATCNKVLPQFDPYQAALCRTITSGDGTACGTAGDAIEIAACRAQAATMATISAGEIPMPTGLSLPPHLAWLTLAKIGAKQCQAWADSQSPASP